MLHEEGSRTALPALGDGASEAVPKEKNPIVPDMAYPVQQPVRKSFLDFPPGIGWI